MFGPETQHATSEGVRGVSTGFDVHKGKDIIQVRGSEERERCRKIEEGRSRGIPRKESAAEKESLIGEAIAIRLKTVS